MRYVVIGLILAGFAGCGVETVTTTAIGAGVEAQNAASAINQGDAAKGQLAKTKIENAVKAYYATNAAYPGSLADLVPDYLPEVPTKADGTPFNYDAVTGAIN